MKNSRIVNPKAMSIFGPESFLENLQSCKLDKHLSLSITIVAALQNRNFSHNYESAIESRKIYTCVQRLNFFDTSIMYARSVVLSNTVLSSWGQSLCTVKKAETCFILQNIPEIWKSCKNDGELYFCSYKGNLPEWRKWLFPKQRFWCQKSLFRRLNQRWGKVLLKLYL